jgi:hypothetical protein
MIEAIKPKNWAGGRKLFAYFAALAAVFTLGVLGKMDGQNLEVSLNWIVSAFIAGNVGEWFAKKENGKPDE